MRLAFLLGVLWLILASLQAHADEARTETLRFAKGATGTSVSSNISGYNMANYRVTAKTGHRSTTSVPKSGTYTIQIHMMRSAARRDETADYKLRVEIDGGKTSEKSDRVPSNKRQSGLAWQYDASGVLPCSAGEPSFQRQCTFKVKRI